MAVTQTRHSVRGRGFALGLALLPFALSSCGGDGRPVAEPNEGYVEPSVLEVGGYRVVDNKAPREILTPFAELPSRELASCGLSSWGTSPRCPFQLEEPRGPTRRGRASSSSIITVP
jgi:hypothetical protein